METKVTTLKNVELSKLKSALSRSLSISEDDTLNFTITNEKVANVCKNGSDSLYKRWSLNTADLCEAEHIEKTIKVAIHKGNEFNSKVLGAFDQLADIEFHHIGGEVNKINICKKDDKGRNVMNITVVTASVNTAFIEHDPEMLQQLFSPSEESLDTKIVLRPEDLKQVNTLSKFTTNPETQTAYVKLYTEEGQLVATDNAFKIALYETDEVIEGIEVDKKLWGSLDYETYDIEIHKISDANKMMVCNARDIDVQASLVLLTKTDDDLVWDDFASDVNWENEFNN